MVVESIPHNYNVEGSRIIQMFSTLYAWRTCSHNVNKIFSENVLGCFPGATTHIGNCLTDNAQYKKSDSTGKLQKYMLHTSDSAHYETFKTVNQTCFQLLLKPVSS